MTSAKTICVFCGSSTQAAEKYMTLAREAGSAIARHGFGMVYGGSRNGLMGAAADAVLQQKGQVVGVIPHLLVDMEVAHGGLSELHLTDGMHERQVGMMDRADLFLILPGGLGTLAEFFEVLTWKSLKLHSKPIVLLNAFNYWDSLLSFIDHAVHEKFTHSNSKSLYETVEDIKGLEDRFGILKKSKNSVSSDC